jgi:hypothetical protein
MPRPSLPTDRPFTTAEALSLGHSRKALSRLAEKRVFRRLFTGVYLHVDVPTTQPILLAAARLATGEDAVLCDRTAAWVWGVDVFGYAELDTSPPLETYRLRGRRRTDRDGCAGGTRDLRPEDWCTIDGVRVTTPLRTALDLACNLYPRAALAAMDALARAHGFTSTDLIRLLPRYFRRRGVVQARRLVRLVDPRVESPPESWVREVLDVHEFVMPTPQYWVVEDGLPVYRLDLAYEHAKIAIEYDGEEFHSSAADRERDAERRAWLRARGWYVIVLTKHSFTPEAIDLWTRELRAELALRTRSHKRF